MGRRGPFAVAEPERRTRHEAVPREGADQGRAPAQARHHIEVVDHELSDSSAGRPRFRIKWSITN
jgi:hypothetical protein